MKLRWMCVYRYCDYLEKEKIITKLESEKKDRCGREKTCLQLQQTARGAAAVWLEANSSLLVSVVVVGVVLGQGFARIVVGTKGQNISLMEHILAELTIEERSLGNHKFVLAG